MHHGVACEDEGQQVVQAQKSVYGGVLYGQTTPQPGHEGIPNHRECASEHKVEHGIGEG